MGNKIDYFISSVWKTSQDKIISVYLHRNEYDPIKNSNTFSNGVKTSENDVIRLIRQGLHIKTLLWNYQYAKWEQGAILEIVKQGNSEFLRSHKDAKIIDNLDNMINMDGFI